MTPPGQEFVTNVAELERCAAQLPQVADALRRPVATLTEHTATSRPMEIGAVSVMERTYGALTEDIAARQRVMCDRIAATAEALGEIAAVYRRVDGAGLTMTNPATSHVTYTDLEAAAFGLAHSMLEMLDRDGVGPDVIGVSDQMDVDVFRRTFEVDAEVYLSMNPARLTEEYNEIRTAANANGIESDPHSIVDAAIIDLQALWHGEAATAFFEQLSRVQNRIQTQHDYTLVAAQAVGMMYAVSVAFRNSCHSLMTQTAVVCNAIADKHAPEPTNWAKVAVDIVDKAIDVVSSPKDLLRMGIDEAFGGLSAATESKDVTGADALPVVDGYVAARDELFASYEDSVGRVNDWIADRRKEFEGLDGTLPEPLPASADVDSPAFTYPGFYFGGHTPADFASEVERERRRYADEKTRPDGIIAQRLAGTR